MAISPQRATEIRRMAECEGISTAAARFGISLESAHRYVRLANQGLPVAKGGARILLFDIETTPMLAYTWGVWKQDIHPEFIVEHATILSYAAKWLGDDMVYFVRKGETDEAIVADLARLCDEADIVVAHNGRAFDTKRIWTRMAYWGIEPPVPYKIVDTCLVARKYFDFPHNSLKGLGRYLGLGDKEEHEGFGLWLKCMAGDESAWQRMERYNIQDVALLEALYLRLRAWDRRHPSVALYHEDSAERCVCCGKATLKEMREPARTNISEFAAYRCESCGKVMRSGSRAVRDTVMRPIL